MSIINLRFLLLNNLSLSEEFASGLKKGEITPQKIKSRNSIDVDKEGSLTKKKQSSFSSIQQNTQDSKNKPQQIADSFDDNSSFYMEQSIVKKNLQESRDSSSRNSLIDSTGSTIPDLMGTRRLSIVNDFANLIPKEEQ